MEVRTTSEHSWWTIDDAFKVFNIDRVRLWKATSSSCDEPPTEPDMPHDTYFSRESNLYVDILENGGWSVPASSWARHQFNEPWEQFELRHQTKSHLAAFESLKQGGALDNSALLAMNGIWKGHYVNEDTQLTELHDLWCRTARQSLVSAA